MMGYSPCHQLTYLLLFGQDARIRPRLENNLAKKMTASDELADATTSTPGSEKCVLKGADGPDVVYCSENGLCTLGAIQFRKNGPAPRLSLERRLGDPDVLAFFLSSTPWLSSTLTCAQRRISEENVCCASRGRVSCCGPAEGGI